MTVKNFQISSKTNSTLLAENFYEQSYKDMRKLSEAGKKVNRKKLKIYNTL